MNMTQAINFNELRDAFAPTRRTDAVVDLYGNKVSTAHRSESDQDLLKENQRLKDILATTNEQLESVESAYQKTLRHVNSMMHEKMEFDGSFQKLHDDKMRLVRTIQNKQHEVEVLKKSVHELESSNQKLKSSLSNSKHSNNKLNDKLSSQAKEIKSLRSMMKRMSAEMVELRVTKSLKHKVAEQWEHIVDVTMAYAAELKDKVENLRPRKKTKLPTIQWASVNHSLPSNQVMVYVRNDTESDVAVFNPTTRRFKCAHKPIKILEWAPMP
jgi:chromosome segregation ATPase